MSAAAREGAIAAVLLVLLAARAAWGLVADASVADEHPHILSGWLYWQSGRFGGGVDNPPLGQLLVSLPLVRVRLPYASRPTRPGRRARSVVVLRSGSASGVALGRVLGGPAVGMLALAGLVFEPNWRARQLATLDAPLTVRGGRRCGRGAPRSRRGRLRARPSAAPPSVPRAPRSSRSRSRAAATSSSSPDSAYPVAWCIAVATPNVPRGAPRCRGRARSRRSRSRTRYGFAPLAQDCPSRCSPDCAASSRIATSALRLPDGTALRARVLLYYLAALFFRRRGRSRPRRMGATRSLGRPIGSCSPFQRHGRGRVHARARQRRH